MFSQIGGTLSQLGGKINGLNDNKYFVGILVLLLNFGSKYVQEEIGIFADKILSSRIARRLIIFSMCFFATRDIIISLILTAAFVIISFNLINEKSYYSILPESYKAVSKEKSSMTPQEIKKAYIQLVRRGEID